MHSIRIRFLCPFLGALLAGSACYGNAAYLAVVSDDSFGSLAATTSDPAQLSGTFSRGAGLNAEALFAGYYDASGWSESSSLPATPTNDDYFEFSISVANGYTFTPSALDFYYEEGGNFQGPSRISLRSSLDNYNSELFLDTNTFDASVHNVDLSSYSDITGTVAFRWYGYGAGDSSGLLGFSNSAQIDADGTFTSVNLSGDLAPVPEPRVIAWVIGAAVFSLVSRRRP
jgi:hypothetical protein